MSGVLLLNANSLAIPLADKSVHCVVTSPPYWALRDYGVSGQLGLEPLHDCLGWATGAPCGECFVCHVVAWAREVWRVLRDDGTFWMNIGDSYANIPGNGSGGETPLGGEPHRSGGAKVAAGLKPKDLCMIPARVALALQADGWYVRSDIVWHKLNPMPESATDRPTKSHEYVWLLTKSPRYFYDQYAVRESSKPESASRYNYDFTGRPGLVMPDGKGHQIAIHGAREFSQSRNLRTVWTLSTESYHGSHYATFPRKLVEPCIKAGTNEAGCCPECGTQWVRVVENGNGRGRSWHNHKNDAETGMSKSVIEKRPYAISSAGFRPSCTCQPHTPIPCTVLDPFAGSGTTLLVARSLGRNAVGLDLSYSYLHDQARKRLSLDALDDWSDGNGEQGGAGVDDLPLWGGA